MMKSKAGKVSQKVLNRKSQVDSPFAISKSLICLEYILLAICLCVIVIRVTYTEGATVQSVTLLLRNLSHRVYTLSISAVLIFSLLLWFLWSLFNSKLLYRFTGIEIGLCLFCIATVVAGFAASDKRIAITNFVTLAAPVIMAVLLVQILDSYSKIKLLLCVIAALAVVSACISAWQFFISDRMLIEQYEEIPQTIIEPLGIKSGSFEQFHFERGLYSKGVRGFFSTNNSAGSFAIMGCFAAIALFIDKFKTRNSYSKARRMLTGGIVVAVAIFALAITRSKGAIIASLFAAIMFLAYLLFSNWIKAHRKTLLIACLLFFIAGTCVVTWYGLTHGRLPGGNSMLVRWQYWQASAKMYADHALTGIGPANFASFYPSYKPPAALESVTEPHNFPLSILTQYGPLGLIGFLAMILIPLLKVIFPKRSSSSAKTNQHRLRFKVLAIIYLIVLSIALLLIRPAIMPTLRADTPEKLIYDVLPLYIVPVVAFIIGFVLLIANENTRNQDSKQQTQSSIRNPDFIAAALFCAVVGVILHNLIDFAIFEPPVLTIFWAIIACLIAINNQQNSRPYFILKSGPFLKVTATVITVLIILAYLNYALIPAAKNIAKIQQANRNAHFGYSPEIHNNLNAAAQEDRLDPIAPNLNAGLYVEHFLYTGKKQRDLIKKIEQLYLNAIERDEANFINYDKLSMFYDLIDRPKDAYDWGLKAAKHHPTSSRIQFRLAEIAEKLNNTDNAINHYKKVIDIVNSFRHQFQLMFPDEEIVGRLEQDKYNLAQDRLQKLSNPER